MSFGAFLPDRDGPGTPFESVDAGPLWGPAFRAPLSAESPPATDGGLMLTLVGVDTSGSQELDNAAATAVAFDTASGQRRAYHAAAVRHALTGALFHVAEYASAEASFMMHCVYDGVSPPVGAATEIPQPRLVFNAEAAIFQLRAALDVLVRSAIDEGLTWSGQPSYGKLRTRMRTWSDQRASLLQERLEEFAEAHSELEKARNRIAHPQPGQPNFGSFAILPRLPSHSVSHVAFPQYEGRRSKDVLINLEQKTRAHLHDFLEILWGQRASTNQTLNSESSRTPDD